MKKLNNKKIRWIIRWKQQGKTNKELAISQNISIRRVEQILKLYAASNEVPMLRRCGRQAYNLTNEQKDIVIKTFNKYRVGAVYLEKLIEKQHNIKISHNKIHSVLKENNLANDEPNKKKQRKWVRYERKHSLSLVHMDWHELNGKHITLAEDDASRMIIAGDEFDNETGENTINVLESAVKFAKPYGGIVQVISDHGSQFYANKNDGECQFQKRLKELGIEHILARIKHPQTNGKLEKLFDLYDKKMHLFKSLEEFIYWYNYMKPHRSLDFENAETPSEAFRRKLKTETLLGLAVKLFGW